jgi:hypothetical protein
MDENPRKLKLQLIWGPIIALIGIISVVIVFTIIRQQIPPAPLPDFDKMTVTDGFHHILVPSGQTFNLSYEQKHDRVFEGLVRHTNIDYEVNFPILSHDILVTSGDYANSALVSTSVEDHHFTWIPITDAPLQGTINLLHTVPMNEAVEKKLAALQEGEIVKVTGWDIYKIEGYDAKGNYIGYWTDEGCNTILVTDVIVEKSVGQSQ